VIRWYWSSPRGEGKPQSVRPRLARVPRSLPGKRRQVQVPPAGGGPIDICAIRRVAWQLRPARRGSSVSMDLVHELTADGVIFVARNDRINLAQTKLHTHSPGRRRRPPHRRVLLGRARLVPPVVVSRSTIREAAHDAIASQLIGGCDPALHRSSAYRRRWQKPQRRSELTERSGRR
jgi:hypothetical protein